MQFVTPQWLRTTMSAKGPTSNLGPLGKKAVIDVLSGSVQKVSSICSLLSTRFNVNATLVTQHLTHQFVKLWTLHIKMNNTKSSQKIKWAYPDRPLLVGYVIVIHTTSSSKILNRIWAKIKSQRTLSFLTFPNMVSLFHVIRVWVNEWLFKNAVLIKRFLQ